MPTIQGIKTRQSVSNIPSEGNGISEPQHQIEAEEVTFQIAGVDIERVSSFRYLGRILDEIDDDSHALTRQLARARARWGRIASVLWSEGVNPRAMG